jgi:hypothetical protein
MILITVEARPRMLFCGRDSISDMILLDIDAGSRMIFSGRGSISDGPASC